eukprot:765383-Hanusia_phi.AAC.3
MGIAVVALFHQAAAALRRNHPALASGGEFPRARSPQPSRKTPVDVEKLAGVLACAQPCSQIIRGTEVQLMRVSKGNTRIARKHIKIRIRLGRRQGRAEKGEDNIT